MANTKISVSKAFNEIVYPEMEKDGFVKLTSKIYARLLENDLLQFISLHVENRLRREYIIQYGVILVAEPHDFYTLTLGGDFSKGTSGGSYGAQHQKMLDLSIQRALIAYTEEIRPVLRQSDSLKNLLKSMKSS